MKKVTAYLTILAVVLGFVVVLILVNNPSAKVIFEKGKERYSEEEVMEHNSAESCWISIGRKVYDITLFLQIYPEDLNEKCGKALDINYFPLDVRKILEQYEIGVLK